MNSQSMRKSPGHWLALGIVALVWAAAAQAVQGADVSGAQTAGAIREITFYTGASTTAPTAIVIDQQGHPATTIDDVRFLNKPFVMPPYYGIRVRWDWPAPGERLDRIGTELEFVHFKIYYESGDDPGGVIQRFDVTDGLNFLYLNAVGSKELRSGLRLSGRIGVGPVIAHPETEIRHQKKGFDGDWNGFEYAGLTWQGSVALEKLLDGPVRRSRVFVEYKYTAANPVIAIAGGSATTSVKAHHLVAGLSVQL